MFEQARTFESAQKNSDSYFSDSSRIVSATSAIGEETTDEVPVVAAAAAKVSKCFFCGSARPSHEMSGTRGIVS